MAKTSKKALGATMAGVMALGAIAGTVNAVDQVKVANAAESQALKDAQAKISHLTWSLKNNYLGLKNQGQWEVYIKEAKALIAKMPSAEKTQADAFTAEVNRDQELVKALAAINQVEKSYATNYQGIKNAEQWRAYLNAATESLKSVDQKEFANQYAELVSRLNVSSDNVKKIEDEYATQLAAATKLYDDAKASMNLEDAKKALTAAEALGTCASSDALEANVKALIAQIEKVDVTVKTISIDKKTYDDNTKNQRLSIKVNGEAMNIDFLKAAGYTLEFNAIKDKDNSDANSIFFGEAKSNSGKIANLFDEDNLGDYKVTVTATKGGSIIISDSTIVTIENLDSTASSITKNELTANGVVLNSTTLVTGEGAAFTKVEVKDGSSETDVTNGIKLVSSNEGVVSVSADGKKLTAQTPGKATVTINYGSVKKEVTLTVTNAKRKIAKVTPDKSSITAIIDGVNPTNVEVKFLDQYGDPIKDATLVDEDKASDKTSDAKIGVVEDTDLINSIKSATTKSNEKGVIKLAIKATTGKEASNGSVLFKNEDGSIIGRISIATTKTNNTASTKLELLKESNKYFSEDLTISNVGPFDSNISTTPGTSDSQSDIDARAKYKGAVVKIALNEYTSQGVLKGRSPLVADSVKLNEKLLTAKVDTVNNVVYITAAKVATDDNKSGSSDVLVTDANGKQYKITVKVTAESTISIKDITWTSVTPYVGDTVTASDVLKLAETSVDPIIDKDIVKLSSTSAHKIRVEKKTGIVYLDKDLDDGVYTEDKDIKLGTLKVKVTGDKLSVNAATADKAQAFTGVTVGKDQKGTIIFYVEVKNADGDTEMGPSTSVVVK